MIADIILFLAWINIALAEGMRDGFYYHARMTSTNCDKHNIHWLFAFERAIALGLICWIHAISHSLLNTGVFAFSLILIFSFLHNGRYYMTRNFLDKNVYPKGWWDNSTSSQATLEFNVVSRTFMAIVGLVGIVSSFTFK